MRRTFTAISGFLLIAFFLFQKWGVVKNIAIVLMYTAGFSLFLAPICRRMEQRGIKSTFAALCVVVSLFMLMSFLAVVLIPYLAGQTKDLYQRIAPIAAGIMRRLTQWESGFNMMRSIFADAGGAISIVLRGFAGKALQAGACAAKQLGNIGFSLILTYYVLCDRKRIGRHLLLLVPTGKRVEMLSALNACKNAIMGYLGGLIKTSAFVMAATAVVLLSLRVRDALLLSFLMGVFEIFPYVGPILAGIPIMLSAMMMGSETALLVLLMIVLVQMIEGNVISPYFTAASTSVHPLAAILSVYVFGGLFGLWGVLLAVPSLAVFQNLFCSLRQTRNRMDAEFECAEEKFCGDDD